MKITTLSVLQEILVTAKKIEKGLALQKQTAYIAPKDFALSKELVEPDTLTFFHNDKKYFRITDEAKLNTSELLQKCRDKFNVYSYYDDKKLDKDFPIPKEATTRYFNWNIEADKNLENKSADDLEKNEIKVITLRERIILELEYFNLTGKHLDNDNVTLCSGSRYSDGYVPCARWRGGRFSVDWYCHGSGDPFLRAREAVSLIP